MVPLIMMWYVVSFEAYKSQKRLWIIVVAVGHLIASYLTLINTAQGTSTCAASTILLFGVLVAFAAIATTIVLRTGVIHKVKPI